jgi:hypothetical protein
MATVSRQREWQVKRVSEGKCGTCGNPRNLYAYACDECQADVRRRVRANSGLKPWRKGKRGRPPKWAGTTER